MEDISVRYRSEPGPVNSAPRYEESSRDCELLETQDLEKNPVWVARGCGNGVCWRGKESLLGEVFRKRV